MLNVLHTFSLVEDHEVSNVSVSGGSMQGPVVQN